jgi:CheY-like chemotaxis protein
MEGEQTTRLRGARILLTEDNDINQQIAIELLEGTGALVTVANNGREAVEILSNGPQPPPFDVVLMDLQMPVMDGYQATAKLRSDARFATLTIIAMTAHATIEERQRCLAAGMNDHISKPIDPDNLFETVGWFYKPANPTGIPAPVAAKTIEAPAPKADELLVIAGLDTNDGLTRVAGNRKLYLKLLRQFVEQQGPAVGEITAALAAGDVALAERLAHTLKGVAGNIGAKSVQSAAGALEKHIRAKAAAGEVDSVKQEVAAALAPLVAQMRSALNSAPPETPPQTQVVSVASPEQSREAAAALIKLLSECDPGAADFIEVNRAALQPLFSEGEWPQFDGFVQGYAFADAQAQLEQALKSLT